MSYAMMDHAQWAESNIAAMKKHLSPKQRKDKRKGWASAPDKLDPFQRTCMNIIGIAGRGIYNAPIRWETIEWGHRYMRVAWHSDLSTFDGDTLTILVFAAHLCRVRVTIRPANFRYLEILFHPRKAEGGISERHPSLEQMLERMRTYIPDDAPICVSRDAMLEADHD